MRARIYKPAKTAMSSGTAKTRTWVLEFAPETPREVDPLMGWTSSNDTQAQVRLTFESREAAEAYAKERGHRRSGDGRAGAAAQPAPRRLRGQLRHQAPRRLDALSGPGAFAQRALRPSQARHSAVPLAKALRSACPSIPGTMPVPLYCQNVQV